MADPESEATPPIGARDVAAVAAILALFILSQALAILLVNPFAQSGVKGFEDPEDWRNGIWLLLTVVVFTVIILYIAKKKMYGVLKGIILGSVGLTLVYVFYPLLDLIPHPFFDWRTVAGLPLHGGMVIGIPAATLLTILLWKFPEWYIVDAIGVSISAGSIAIFGQSFTPVTYLVVLVGFAVYDYVSVYRTRHMLALADNVLDLQLPIMLVVPRSMDYSFLEEKGRARQRAAQPEAKKPRDAMFIGLGDVVIPSIFAVTALTLSPWAAFGSFVGIGVGLVVLLGFVLRGRPHAGLPSLNGGAFLGFLVGLYADKGTLVFW